MGKEMGKVAAAEKMAMAAPKSRNRYYANPSSRIVQECLNFQLADFSRYMAVSDLSAFLSVLDASVARCSGWFWTLVGPGMQFKES
jgi:hypothetical protein